MHMFVCTPNISPSSPYAMSVETCVCVCELVRSAPTIPQANNNNDKQLCIHWKAHNAANAKLGQGNRQPSRVGGFNVYWSILRNTKVIQCHAPRHNALRRMHACLQLITQFHTNAKCNTNIPWATHTHTTSQLAAGRAICAPKPETQSQMDWVSGYLCLCVPRSTFRRIVAAKHRGHSKEQRELFVFCGRAPEWNNFES